MSRRCPACGGHLTRTEVIAQTLAHDVWHRANLVTIQATSPQRVTVDACDRCEYVAQAQTARAEHV